MAAKKVWEGSSVPVPTSLPVKSPKWQNQSVSDGDNAESNEASVIDQMARPSEVEESPESTLGFYADSSSQSLAAGISHVPAGVPFAQTNKRLQQLGRGNRSTQYEQQVYSAQGQSEMVKHVHAKPFQPPGNSPPTNLTHQMVPANRHMTAAAGPTSSAYQLNSAVISIPAGAVQGSSTSTTPSETSSVVTQAPHNSGLTLGFSPVRWHHVGILPETCGGAVHGTAILSRYGLQSSRRKLPNVECQRQQPNWYDCPAKALSGG